MGNEEMTHKEKIKLVEAHWEYMKEVLSWTPMSPTEIKLVEFHYKSAFYHGMKHGEEVKDER